MAAPLSRKRIDRLGEQLRTGGLISGPDLDDVVVVLDFYQELLDGVVARLSSLGFQPTARVKTTRTTVEKLRREQTTKLSRVNDLAGARIVVDGGRPRQDEAVEAVVAAFGAESRSPQILDRRTNPSHGYRAVHVVVYPGNFPVEVQIRTAGQDVWAQIFESLADRWGRQIRYGGEPDSPERTVRVPSLRPSSLRRWEFVELVHALGDELDRVEVSRAQAVRAEAWAAPVRESGALALPRLSDLRSRVEGDGWNAENLARLDTEFDIVRRYARRLASVVLRRARGRRQAGRWVRRGFRVPPQPDLDLLEAQVERLIGQLSLVNAISGMRAHQREATLRAMLRTIAEVDE